MHIPQPPAFKPRFVTIRKTSAANTAYNATKMGHDIHSSILLVNHILTIHQLNTIRYTDIATIALLPLPSIHTTFKARTRRAPRHFDILVVEEVAVGVCRDGIPSLARGLGVRPRYVEQPVTFGSHNAVHPRNKVCGVVDANLHCDTYGAAALVTMYSVKAAHWRMS
jgi:hypothetical protein